MGVGSAPGSVILSVDRSHKGKLVTIQLCREIPGWLVPPPMVDDHATPQRRASKRGPQGVPAGLSRDGKTPK